MEFIFYFFSSRGQNIKFKKKEKLSTELVTMWIEFCVNKKDKWKELFLYKRK